MSERKVLELAGQVAIVTGAGRGIGRALAIALSGAGAGVGLLGREPSYLRDTAAACAGPAVTAVADVTDADSVAAAVESLEADLGPVDLLVNNAGRIDGAEVPPWEADPADWWAVVEANLRGPMLLCRALVPAMVARGRGRIVNINSGMGLQPVPGYSAYSVSKAALARYTDCLAEALRPHGVVAFDLSPGRVRTDMTLGMAMWAGVADDSWTPVDAVVGAVLTLASGRADSLSGRFLHAARDDLDSLIARAGELAGDDARTLRLRAYGPDDPLG